MGSSFFLTRADSLDQCVNNPAKDSPIATSPLLQGSLRNFSACDRNDDLGDTVSSLLPLTRFTIPQTVPASPRAGGRRRVRGLRRCILRRSVHFPASVDAAVPFEVIVLGSWGGGQATSLAGNSPFIFAQPLAHTFFPNQIVGCNWPEAANCFSCSGETGPCCWLFFE